MPSPFPGMDPFLEHPAIFPDLHGRLSYIISESIQACLPEPYFAVINERLWVETSSRYVEPDVDVLIGARQAARSATALLERPVRSRPVEILLPHDEHRETFVEIRTKRENDQERIVTTIEILSLSNKTPGSHGQELYRRKQRELQESDINLVEIDLLRGGEHATAVPRARIVHRAGPFDYHVSVHRSDDWMRYFIYPVLLSEPLPEIAVPLLPGDGDVPLDLQAVFARCYETGPYARRVRYEPARLDPPLDPQRLAWAEQLLAARASSA